jgi:DNA-binding transcriptional MerR regulator
MAVVAGKTTTGANGAEEAAATRAKGDSRPRRALTIGAVAKILSQEFDDISISKIRYLEDQKLLAPRRTAGGYRLYSQADVERLRAILRMQRDEFLPLRVIRQELATGGFTGRRPSGESQKRRAASVGEPVTTFTEEELLEQAGVRDSFLRELQEFGIVTPARHDGRPAYDETDLEIVRAAAELSKFGVAGRNLRVFRTSADREAALLEQLLGAQLRSRSHARRKEAVENLESLAAVCGHLKHLLLVRDLRRLKSTAE